MKILSSGTSDSPGFFSYLQTHTLLCNTNKLFVASCVHHAKSCILDSTRATQLTEIKYHNILKMDKRYEKAGASLQAQTAVLISLLLREGQFHCKN